MQRSMIFIIIIAFIIFALPFLFAVSAKADQIPPNFLPPGGTRDSSDKNAPKEILSTEIVKFSMDYNNSTLSYEDDIPHGVFSLAASADAADKSKALVSVSLRPLRSDKKFSAEFETGAEVLKELQTLVAETGMVRYNGWQKENTALGCHMSVTVKYESGERIRIYGHGGTSAIPWVNGMALVRYFKALCDKNGYDMSSE